MCWLISGTLEAHEMIGIDVVLQRRKLGGPEACLGAGGRSVTQGQPLSPTGALFTRHLQRDCRYSMAQGQSLLETLVVGM